MLNKKAKIMGPLKSMGVLPLTSTGPVFHPNGLSTRSKTETNKISTQIFFSKFRKTELKKRSLKRTLGQGSQALQPFRVNYCGNSKRIMVCDTSE